MLGFVSLIFKYWGISSKKKIEWKKRKETKEEKEKNQKLN